MRHLLGSPIPSETRAERHREYSRQAKNRAGTTLRTSHNPQDQDLRLAWLPTVLATEQHRGEESPLGTGALRSLGIIPTLTPSKDRR